MKEFIPQAITKCVCMHTLMRIRSRERADIKRLRLSTENHLTALTLCSRYLTALTLYVLNT